MHLSPNLKFTIAIPPIYEDLGDVGKTLRIGSRILRTNGFHLNPGKMAGAPRCFCWGKGPQKSCSSYYFFGVFEYLGYVLSEKKLRRGVFQQKKSKNGQPFWFWQFFRFMTSPTGPSQGPRLLDGHRLVGLHDMGGVPGHFVHPFILGYTAWLIRIPRKGINVYIERYLDIESGRYIIYIYTCHDPYQKISLHHESISKEKSTNQWYFLVGLSSEFRDRLILDIDPPISLISRDSEQQSIAHLFHSIMQKSNDLLIQP